MAENRFPGESPPAPTRRRWPRRLGMAVIGVLALVGPWPVDNGSYVGSDYAWKTAERLDAMPGPGGVGPIRIGTAEVDLTPSKPGPLAGFSSQAGKVYEKVDTPCFARALTVASEGRAVTIVAADLLLINEKLARAVLDRSGLRADEVYFTATHTHAGPGGWGRHPLERIVAGKFDPDVLAMLAERIGDVVRRSRTNPVPAEVALVQAHPSGRQKNRVVPGAPTHDALSALVFRPAGAATEAPPLAILTVFGAHATIVRTDPPKLSADYPGALVASLKTRSGAGMVLFAAGAVGDAAPVPPPIPAMTRAASGLGQSLADDLLAALPSARFTADVPLDRLRLPVDLPPVRLAFGSAWLRFSPAATWWIADRSTHLDALRIGPVVLVGFPGDEAGHLARNVVDNAPPKGPTPIVTSFNGDYRGYFESSEIFFDRSCYETRWMNFYGPYLGEYLGEIAEDMIRHLEGKVPRSRMGLRPGEDVSLRMLAAACLDAAISLAMAVQWSKSSRRRGRAGWVAAAVAVIFATVRILVPENVDWAWFEVPPALSWISPAILLIVGVGTCSGRGSPRIWDFLGWAGLGFLLGVWPIVLAGILASLDTPMINGHPTMPAHQSK